MLLYYQEMSLNILLVWFESNQEGTVHNYRIPNIFFTKESECAITIKARTIYLY